MLFRLFVFPVTLSILALAGIWIGYGLEAFILAVILSILEVTLSFDNAVVNAKVLKRMNETWQKRFLTWGILVAVFGTRFVLPIFIVAAAAFASPWAVAKLAATDPAAYGALLEGAHHLISSFGGAFLLMVSLKYFFDHAKDVHWIRVIEKRLSSWGRIEAIEIALALLALIGVAAAAGKHEAGILISGILGIVLFIFMEGLTSVLDASAMSVAKSGLVLFIYLNILDTAFSLDGVVGAFALSTNLAIIAAGLGIGAYFVRTLTVYMVRVKALDSLVYLEHGAHWAIMGLAGAMLVSLVVHVPEILIGGIGLVFILLSYISSRRESVLGLHK